MIIIGVTGNSGSGKSAAVGIIAEKGGYVIDADEIAHNIILKGNAAYNEIIECFGSEILNDDGEINRRSLGEIVFSDKNELEKLNLITHKYIISHIESEIEKEKNKCHSCILIDAPLLFETGLNRLCEKIWLIDADRDVRIERIIKRDNISREMAENRINKQTESEKYRKYADIITDNSGSDKEIFKKQILNDLSRILTGQ